MSSRETLVDEAAHVPQGEPGGHGAPGGHESDRTPLRPVLIGVGVVVGLLVVGFVAPTILQPIFEKRDAALSPPASPLVASAGRELPPGPRLQVNPWRDITEFRAAQERILSSYGWVDRRAGIVHIPIERAIDIIARRQGQGAPAEAGR